MADPTTPRPAPTADRLPVACFAPPLTDELLKKYRAEVEKVEQASAVGDALRLLLVCVEEWWKLPESKRKDGQEFDILHRGQPVKYRTTPLEEDHVERLDDHIPWEHELRGLSDEKDSGLFDKLPAGDLRKVAFHLLWHVKELNAGREPMTTENLPK